MAWCKKEGEYKHESSGVGDMQELIETLKDAKSEGAGTDIHDHNGKSEVHGHTFDPDDQNKDRTYISVDPALRDPLDYDD